MAEPKSPQTRVTAHKCLAVVGAAASYLSEKPRDAVVERGPFGLGIINVGEKGGKDHQVYIPLGEFCPYCGEKIPKPPSLTDFRPGRVTTVHEQIEVVVPTPPEAISVIRAMLDDEPCSYDHDDFCQVHYGQRPCGHERARELLAELE